MAQVSSVVDLIESYPLSCNGDRFLGERISGHEL